MQVWLIFHGIITEQYIQSSISYNFNQLSTKYVISHSVKLLEKNVLRAMDSFHVACALEWQADLFVTSDKRQLIAAKNVGLLTEFIGQP